MVAKGDCVQKVFRKIPGQVLEIAGALQRKGGRVYLVGGAIRDVLLGVEPKDWDLGTTLEPAQVLSVFPSAEVDGIQFGRVRISGVDVVSFRAEGEYLDRRHPSRVELGASVEDDLGRRDFTVNAMALDLDRKELVDPFGGEADLEDRVIRTVGEAEARFSEDPLRILRAFRLKAELGFNMTPEVSRAVRNMASLVSSVSGQRCFSELRGILLSPGAYPTIVELWDAGVLSVALPEILEGCPGLSNSMSTAVRSGSRSTSLQPVKENCSSGRGNGVSGALKEMGSERSTVVYVGKTVGFCPEKLPVRLAALFHLAPPDRWEEASRRFGLSSKLSSHVKYLLNGVPLPAGADPGYVVRKIVKEAGLEKFTDLVALEIAKSLAARGDAMPQVVVDLMAGVFSSRGYPPESYVKLRITGDDLVREAGISRGPELGEVIAYLEEAALRNPDQNTKERLLLLVEEWLKNRSGRVWDEGEKK